MRKKYFFILFFLTLTSNFQAKTRRSKPTENMQETIDPLEASNSSEPAVVATPSASQEIYESLRVQSHREEAKPTLLDVFCTPIIFTDAGFRCYIKHRYNHHEYPDFLSLCFTDMIEFLTWGKRQTSREYPKRILNLFHKKLKSTRHINAFAFQELLKEMPKLLEHYFSTQQINQDQLKKGVNELLYSSFLHRFDQFKQEPENFLDTLSGNIVTMMLESALSEEYITDTDLRNQLLRFLEQGLSKLVWSWEEGAAVWQSFKTIDELIMAFHSAGIFVYEEDLDDLYWTLITSFEYFVELAGAQLPPDVYQHMAKDLKEENLHLLSIDEQEDYIETKVECLQRIIKLGATKAQAHSMGFINELVVA